MSPDFIPRRQVGLGICVGWQRGGRSGPDGRGPRGDKPPISAGRSGARPQEHQASEAPTSHSGRQEGTQESCPLHKDQ